MSYATRIVSAGLLALVAAVGCTDTLDAPTAAPPQVTAPPVLTDHGLRDASIDLTDTHFSAEVTTSTSVQGAEAMLVAPSAAGVTAFEDEAYIEGGFGRDGSLRFSVWFANTEDGVVQLVGDQVNLLDASGRLTASHPVGYATSIAGLPSFTTANAYFVSTPPTCDPTYPECAVLDASAMAMGQGDADVRELRMRPGAAAHGAARTEIVQRYRRVRPAGEAGREQWRLEEVRSTRRVTRGGQDADVTAVTRLRYRVWHRDERRDATREERRRRMAPPRPAATSALAPPPAGAVAPATGTGHEVAGAPSASAVGGLCARGPFNMDTTRTSLARGHSVVYQHGFCSDASVWRAFDQVLSRSVPIERSQAYSLDGTARVEEQARELQTRINGKFPRAMLLIGHSQGGLVLRRVGQMQPQLTTGVITIGTPHRGAPLADLGPEVVSAALANAVISDFCNAPFVCGLVADILAERIAGANTLGVDALAPSLKDLRSESDLQRQLNGTAEPFPRVSIETQIPRRWGIVRYLFDARSAPSNLLRGQRPGGEAAVATADIVYRTAALTRFLSMMAMFDLSLQGAGVNCSLAGYSTLWPGCTDPFAYAKLGNTWYTTVLLAVVHDFSTRLMELMDSIDRTWYQLTTRGEGQYDGLVPARSQHYPNVPGTHEPLRLSASGGLADSHSAQLKSPYVVTLTMDAIAFIANRVFVP